MAELPTLTPRPQTPQRGKLKETKIRQRNPLPPFRTKAHTGLGGIVTTPKEPRLGIGIVSDCRN